MNCTLCGEPISEARLKAIPGATMCRDCAAANDVPLIKRFDDHTASGDTAETYYTNNPVFDAEIERLKDFNPSFVSVDGHYIRDGHVEVNHQDAADPLDEVDSIGYCAVDTPAYQLTTIPSMGVESTECRKRKASQIAGV